MGANGRNEGECGSENKRQEDDLSDVRVVTRRTLPTLINYSGVCSPLKTTDSYLKPLCSLEFQKAAAEGILIMDCLVHVEKRAREPRLPTYTRFRCLRRVLQQQQRLPFLCFQESRKWHRLFP